MHCGRARSACGWRGSDWRPSVGPTSVRSRLPSAPRARRVRPECRRLSPPIFGSRPLRCRRCTHRRPLRLCARRRSLHVESYVGWRSTQRRRNRALAQRTCPSCGTATRWFPPPPRLRTRAHGKRIRFPAFPSSKTRSAASRRPSRILLRTSIRAAPRIRSARFRTARSISTRWTRRPMGLNPLRARTPPRCPRPRSPTAVSPVRTRPKLRRPSRRHRWRPQRLPSKRRRAASKRRPSRRPRPPHLRSWSRRQPRLRSRRRSPSRRPTRPRCWTISVGDQPAAAQHTISVSVQASDLVVTIDGVVQSSPRAAVQSLTISGTAGDDSLDLGGLPMSLELPVIFDGGAGIDIIRGPPADSTWTVTAPGTGTVGSLSFAGVENLVGAANNKDTFAVAADWPHRERRRRGRWPRHHPGRHAGRRTQLDDHRRAVRDDRSAAPTSSCTRAWSP